MFFARVATRWRGKWYACRRRREMSINLSLYGAKCQSEALLFYRDNRQLKEMLAAASMRG